MYFFAFIAFLYAYYIIPVFICNVVIEYHASVEQKRDREPRLKLPQLFSLVVVPFGIRYEGGGEKS